MNTKKLKGQKDNQFLQSIIVVHVIPFIYLNK